MINYRLNSKVFKPNFVCLQTGFSFSCLGHAPGVGLGCTMGPGGVLCYFHTYVDSGHFWGLKILNFNIFGGFRKINIFWGYEVLWIFFWGHHKIELYLGVISRHFRVFS